jgi:hypothetical protein
MKVLPLLATAPMVAAVVFAVPAAATTVSYGPGTYAVPGQFPYGIYRATTAPGAPDPGCTYKSLTSDGKVVDTNSGAFLGAVTAEVLSPNIAQFTTTGCTPWVKVH